MFFARLCITFSGIDFAVFMCLNEFPERRFFENLILSQDSLQKTDTQVPNLHRFVNYFEHRFRLVFSWLFIKINVFVRLRFCIDSLRSAPARRPVCTLRVYTFLRILAPRLASAVRMLTPWVGPHNAMPLRYMNVYKFEGAQRVRTDRIGMLKLDRKWLVPTAGLCREKWAGCFVEYTGYFSIEFLLNSK